MSESVAVASATGFATLGLDSRLVETIGYETPSPIQREAIPVLLSGSDLVGLAGTGTGKTAAFALPIVHKLGTEPERRGAGVSALIVTPTRELAIQVARAVKGYGKPFGVGVAAVYGGTGYGEQITAIRRGVDVIVATPGRALDLVKRGKFPLSNIRFVVLDEADEMLDMGFAEDIDALLSETPAERQTMLFSATMPPRIEEIARRHLRDPRRVAVARETPADGQPAQVRQTAYLVRREHKLAALGRVLTVERPTSAIVFCRTRTEADELTGAVARRGFRPLALHGGMTQDQRDRVMRQFRAGEADLLIATDIAARGLDISHLSHVVNFDVPTQTDAYVHRVGRVGRAGRAGVAITLVTARERSALASIERMSKQRIEFAPIPTARDLRVARLERTRLKLREALTTATPGPDDDLLRGLLAELESEFGTAAVGLALLKMGGEPARPEDMQDIPAEGMRPERNDRPGDRSERGPRREGRPERFEGRPERPERPEPREDEARRAGGRPTSPGMAKVFFGIGRDAGVGARDLVGAIANEAGIPGNHLGTIDLTDRFALVEVPSDVAEYVVETMQGTRIRGRRVMVRPDRAPRGTA